MTERVHIFTVLRMIDALRERGVKSDDFRRELCKTDDKWLPMRMGNDDDKVKDNASHYILRLAYCRSEDLRRWFLTQECALFSARFEASDSEAVDSFMRENGLQYTPIDEDEKKLLKTKLYNSLVASTGGRAKPGEIDYLFFVCSLRVVCC